jgi:hypothetical protein
MWGDIGREWEGNIPMDVGSRSVDGIHLCENGDTHSDSREGNFLVS